MSKRLYTAGRLLSHWGLGGMLACGAMMTGGKVHSVLALFVIVFTVGQTIAGFNNPYRNSQ